MTSQTGEDHPAISCRGVWQVFGADAKNKLAEALASSGGDCDVAAQSLRDDGLIPAVQDASFDVKDGELFVIMGLSGSGKSTIVRCISQLLQATGGGNPHRG